MSNVHVFDHPLIQHKLSVDVYKRQLQAGADALEEGAEHGVEVELPVLELLEPHAAVVPAEQPLRGQEGRAAVAYLAALGGGCVGHEVVHHHIHALERPGGHAHHRRVRVQRAYERQALLPAGGVYGVGLVEHYEVCLLYTSRCV